MRLVWHIYKKDLRHFWWEMTVVTGMLAWFVHLDAWRGDVSVSAAESLLNVLLPLAWAYLIALAVLDDPLEGDRQYWVTLPCSWKRLLGAKILFAVTAVHAPYLVGTCVILLVRGFSPLAYPGELLWKQALIAVAVTLPAIALAAVSRRIAQFMIVAMMITAAAAAFVRPEYNPYILVTAEDVRRGIAFVAFGVGLTFVAWMQYRRRTTMWARAVLVVTTLAGVAVYASVTMSSAVLLKCRMQPSGVSARVEPGAPREFDLEKEREFGYPDAVVAAVPVRIEGLPATRWSMWQAQFQIHTPTKTVVVGDQRFDPRRPFALPLLAAELRAYPGGAGWEIVRAAPETFRSLIGAPVTFSGTAIVRPFKQVGGVTFPVLRTADVPGVGLCSSRILPLGRAHSMLQVNCESPMMLPQQAFVTLASADGCREWWHQMYRGGFRHDSWLSPVRRLSSFFHIAPEEVVSRYGGYMLPADVMRGARISVEAHIPTSCDVVEYEIPNVRLSDYVVRPR
jgi:hypothetical protein